MVSISTNNNQIQINDNTHDQICVITLIMQMSVVKKKFEPFDTKVIDGIDCCSIKSQLFTIF